ncbi:hypothetical protein [Andreprevotia chitinilytica]|uniref:hypothetical protein n=1 Tax=Andreprevotia chitinilytica TaxID=396808 RepID=UPI000553EDBA|nr:hypothetical protein [Andreprevotia chitinilytica]
MKPVLRGLCWAVMLFATAGQASAHALRFTGVYHCDNDVTFSLGTNIQGDIVYLHWQNATYLLHETSVEGATIAWADKQFALQGSPAESTLKRDGAVVATHCAKTTATK